MENENDYRYEKGDGVVIKEPSESYTHRLQVGSKGVVLGLNPTFNVSHEYYDVAGISAIHPDRVIVNVLHKDEFEAF